MIETENIYFIFIIWGMKIGLFDLRGSDPKFENVKEIIIYPRVETFSDLKQINNH